MKRMNLIKLVCVVLATSASLKMAHAAGDQQPPAREVVVGINDVYVPGGFTDDSESYVVVNGIFQNGCYHWKGAEVNHVSEFSHEIKSKALVSQGLCIMVLIPFQKEVRLGKLSHGDHKLKFLNGDGTYLEKTLSIE